MLRETRAHQLQHSARAAFMHQNFIFQIRPAFFRAAARFRFQFIERLKGTILMNGS